MPMFIQAASAGSALRNLARSTTLQANRPQAYRVFVADSPGYDLSEFGTPRQTCRFRQPGPCCRQVRRETPWPSCRNRSMTAAPAPSAWIPGAILCRSGFASQARRSCSRQSRRGAISRSEHQMIYRRWIASSRVEQRRPTMSCSGRGRASHDASPLNSVLARPAAVDEAFSNGRL